MKFLVPFAMLATLSFGPALAAGTEAQDQRSSLGGGAAAGGGPSEETGRLAQDSQFLDRSLVSDIQQTLRDRGYAVGAVDGVVGPNTRSALSSFQRDLGMPGTGNVDAQTLAALNLPATTQQGQLPQGAGQEGLISRVPQEPGNITTPGVSRPLSETVGDPDEQRR